MLYSPKRSLRGIGIFEIPIWLILKNPPYHPDISGSSRFFLQLIEFFFKNGLTRSILDDQTAIFSIELSYVKILERIECLSLFETLIERDFLRSIVRQVHKDDSHRSLHILIDR